MCKRIIPFTFSLLFVVAAMAQDIRTTKFNPADFRNTNASARVPCDDSQVGGPITFEGIQGESNSIPAIGETIFLCANDSFNINDIGLNAIFNGDPAIYADAGVGFAIYDTIPTIDGPNIAAILRDSLIGDPMESGEIRLAVDADDPFGGSTTFRNIGFTNGQSIPDIFNNGESIQWWFAPITIDSIGADDYTYKQTPDGQCVSVGLDQIFSVVYLKPVEFVNVTYPFGTDGSKARLNVTGGLPEFDETQNYTFSIINVADPSIRGSVVEGGLGHRAFPVIQVPCPGDYRVEISDGRSCALETIIPMDQFQKPENSLDIIVDSPAGASVGQEVCVDITTENYDSIVGGTFYLCWDTTFLEFREVNNVISPTWLFGESLVNEGALIPNFLEQDFFGGTTYTDGTILFSICFEARTQGTTRVEFCEDDPRPNSNNPPDIVIAPGDQVPFPLKPENNGQPIEISDPDALNVILIEDDVKDACVGEDNGAFSFQVLGGLAPYQVFWTDVLTGTVDGPLMINEQDGTGEIIGLSPGDYTYEVFDSGVIPNRKISGPQGPVTIRSADLGVNGLLVSTPTCNADSNGVLEAQISLDGVILTDISNFTFAWLNAAGDTIPDEDENIIRNLPSGSYGVVAFSNNGCTAFNPSTTLTQPAAMSVTPTSNDPSCSGVEDGSINISDIDGGNGPYTFAWSDGSDQATNNNIASDNYKFTITDSGGCPLRDSFLLTAENEFSVSLASIDQVQCFGFADGALNVNRSIDRGTGATGTFNFMWSANTTDISGITSISSVASNLAPGSYSVTLTNDALPGCEATETFEITEPDSLLIETIAITDVTSCSLTNPDGGATATITGGTIALDYQYTWDTMDVTVGAANMVMNQASGMITLTVEDDNGCITEKDTTIGTPPAPRIDFFDPVALNCATDFGSLQVIAVAGRPNVDIIEYQWSHDPNLNNSVANNLRPDTFMVTVIDADQCASQAISFVTAPEAIRTDTVEFLKEPCFGVEDGVVSVTLAGGVSNNYQIEWNAVNESPVLGTNATLTSIPSGDYMLSVLDDNNCPFDTMITLNSIPKIEVTFDLANVTGVDCFDTVNPADCNGAAAATAAYEGAGGGAFTFTWDATNETSGATTNMFSSNSLCAGMQALTVSDGQCEVTDSVNIPSPDRLEFDVANATITPATCFGDTDGIAEVAATGGTGGFTFTWPDGGMETTKMGLAATTYQLTITDANNCITTHDVEINQPDAALTASIDMDNSNGVVCQGDADGLITVVVAGGNDGDKNFTWTNNVSTINSAAGLSPGNYIIIVTDSKGCTDDTDFLVAEPEPITAQIDFDPIQCFGFQTGIRISAPTGGNGKDYSFAVDNSPARPSNESIQDFGGDKLISLFDATGCRVDTMVTIPQPRELLVGFAENLVEVDLGGEIPINLLIDGDAPVDDIFWTQNGGEVNDSIFTCLRVPCDNPTVNPLNNTNFTAFVTDANGCMSEASIQVDVDKNRNVYIPNVFAPNNAGFDTNDRFGVFTGSGVSKINYAKVFNRWGTMVADVSETIVQGVGQVTQVWDGQLKGEKANQGVYIYIIEIEFIDGQKLLYRGDVALLR